MQCVLEIKGMKKAFPGVRALNWSDDSSVKLAAGEIWTLAGENGAGKSTLTQILAGIYAKDGGEVRLRGEVYEPMNVRGAWRAGVAVVLQEPGLISSLTVAENLFIGREERFTRFGIQNPRLRRALARDVLKDVCPHVDPDVAASGLSLEDQKLVELARALSLHPSVLIIDETSAVLSKESARVLFEKMAEARDAGTVVLFVSHRMDEVFAHTDNILVLKDGELVTTVATRETNPDELAELMVGREVDMSMVRVRPSGASDDPAVLEVDRLSLAGRFEDISFRVNPGEVVGIGGLAGAGQEEILRTLFGDLTPSSGDVYVGGQPVRIRMPKEAIAHGFAFAPRNRDREGIVLGHSIQSNISLPILPRMARSGFIDRRRERELADKLIEDLKIKCRTADDACLSLSGGNRQKVVLARWIASEARVLLLDNPTRGIDVGAKAEIYALLNKLTELGIGIVMVSDELPELIGMSDHIMILRGGTISAEFTWEQEATEQELIRHMV